MPEREIWNLILFYGIERMSLKETDGSGKICCWRFKMSKTASEQPSTSSLLKFKEDLLCGLKTTVSHRAATTASFVW
jgi:hypothetical protein